MEFPNFEEIENLKNFINITRIIIEMLVITNVVTFIAYLRK